TFHRTTFIRGVRRSRGRGRGRGYGEGEERRHERYGESRSVARGSSLYRRSLTGFGDSKVGAQRGERIAPDSFVTRRLLASAIGVGWPARGEGERRGVEIGRLRAAVFAVDGTRPSG